MADQEILKKLSVELTEELVRRLVGYCAMKAERRPWYGLVLRDPPSMAEGKQPEDLAQTVVEKTIQGAIDGPGKGRRMWDGRRDLYDYLTSQVDSEIDNLGTKRVNQHFRLASRERKISEEGDREDFFESVGDDKAENPEAMLLREELEEASDRFVDAVLDAIEGEGLLMSVVEQILDGARKPAEIAKALDVPVDKIYNARKRLGRRLEDVRAKRLKD